MATQPDPVKALAAVVNQLYDMSSNPKIQATQQQQLLTQAHDLRGDLVALVAVQLSADDAEYKDLMTNLSSVTDSLNAAEQKIQDLINKVGAVADVTAAVDGLIAQAVQLGETAAKLSVA